MAKKERREGGMARPRPSQPKPLNPLAGSGETVSGERPVHIHIHHYEG